MRRAVFFRLRFFGPNFAMNMAGDGFYGFPHARASSHPAALRARSLIQERGALARRVMTSLGCFGQVSLVPARPHDDSIDDSTSIEVNRRLALNALRIHRGVGPNLA